MIHEEFLFKILYSLHKSKKSSFLLKKYNVIVFKVFKYVTKKEIESVFNRIYNLKIKNIKTLIIKGKIKRYKKYSGRCVTWKKSYVTFTKNHQFDVFLKSLN